MALKMNDDASSQTNSLLYNQALYLFGLIRVYPRAAAATSDFLLTRHSSNCSS